MRKEGKDAEQQDQRPGRPDQNTRQQLCHQSQTRSLWVFLCLKLERRPPMQWSVFFFFPSHDSTGFRTLTLKTVSQCQESLEEKEEPIEIRTPLCIVFCLSTAICKKFPAQTVAVVFALFFFFSPHFVFPQHSLRHLAVAGFISVRLQFLRGPGSLSASPSPPSLQWNMRQKLAGRYLSFYSTSS